MITLTLLHPVQSTPVQSWSFEKENVIRIGRAVDNHVVLYSAVVSRHHVELRRTGPIWEVVNLGTNGTYLDGKRIHQAPLTDGGTIRLARSGPNIQVRIGDLESVVVAKTRAVETAVMAHQTEREDRQAEAAGKEDTDDEEGEPDAAPFYISSGHSLPYLSFLNPEVPDRGATPPLSGCFHGRAEEGLLFCIDCGQPLKVWKTIGKYRVVNLMGEGGKTFLVWRQGYTLVLKTLKFEWLERQDGIEQFQQQARVLCQLNHPGLPKIFEAFMIHGQPFLAMEMIHGLNLKQWVTAHGPLSQSQAIAWGVEICDILAYLHQQEPPIVHQGVKPGNLIRPRMPHTPNQVLLVDLGEVRLMNAEALTFTGSIGYTAPEQQEGRPIPASDLYSLGATLVYLLTGQQPETFYRWGAEEFRLYVEDIPNLTPEMATLLTKLTQPRPEDRYTSAQELAAALQALP